MSRPRPTSAPRPPAARTNSSRRPPIVNETSAGGLVCRTVAGAVEGVLIGRLDRKGVLRWLLPKGHVEAGESTGDAAVREVAEETGIAGHIVADLGSLDYWFTFAGRRVHKTVHHYLLEADGGELSAADVEVDEVSWMPLAEVLQRLAYEDERRLAARVPGLLASGA